MIGDFGEDGSQRSDAERPSGGNRHPMLTAPEGCQTKVAPGLTHYVVVEVTV